MYTLSKRERRKGKGKEQKRTDKKVSNFQLLNYKLWTTCNILGTFSYYIIESVFNMERQFLASVLDLE